MKIRTAIVQKFLQKIQRHKSVDPFHEEAQLNVRYAGFGKRLVASFLDNIVQIGLISTPIYFIYQTNPQMNYGGDGPIWLELILMVCFVLLCWIWKGATPGKMLLKMKIVDAKTLEPVPASRLCLRFFSYFIALLPCFLGFFMILWTKKKQGLHDKIAGTIVMIEGSEVSPVEQLPAEESTSSL